MDNNTTAALCMFAGAAALISLNLSHCGPVKSVPNWEYQVVNVPIAIEDIRTDNGVDLKNEDLNALGKTGWELVTGFEEIETTFPNLGDAKYVTGLQPNVRPKRAVLVFKRATK